MESNESFAHTESHVHRDGEGVKIGIWLFLFAELVLFGGMFIVYTVYRFKYPDQFHLAAMEMNTTFGTINTIILLTGSLTMVLSIAAIQRKNRFLSILFVASTIFFGLLFLVNKFIEWSNEIGKGIYPGSDALLKKGNGEVLFFDLYFAMTGLHGLHVFIGIIVLTFMLVFLLKNKIVFDNYIKLENSGLYWHLVVVIWIFLFPLFYLIQ